MEKSELIKMDEFKLYYLGKKPKIEASYESYKKKLYIHRRRLNKYDKNFRFS